MKEMERVDISYVGFKSPETIDEVELEILGLRTAIAVAQQRIAVLEQSIKMQAIMIQVKKDANATITKAAPDSEKTK